ncbi:MAG: AAA family ATPase [Faecalibacterium prausnitzii]|uniref:AAA family ATPase n=1 Tax=Faecalibacterium prausnitzii TaxID=853 RepID=A0A943IUB9_9FIRM|nr:AAA family ATPase [Faecalibacterium prausnitzii]
MEHENDIKEALDFVSPSALTYEEWLMVGMGLKEAGLPVAVWEQWSARDGGRYHKGECIKKWESFHGSSKPITQSSIFQLAYEHGWSGPAGRALDWGDELTVGPQQPALVDPRWVEEQELHLPDTWEPAQQLKRYLQALFEPDEYVAYVTESFMAADRRRPAKGCWDRTAGQLIEELDACGDDVGKVMGDCDPEIGAWICFNPVDGTGRKDANVTSFRYALVECDNMEPGKQLAAIHQMELPCAALVYSGGKSIHAIVRVNAPDYAEYRKRVDYLYATCQKNGLTLDQQNRNPSRLSRMPGILRAGQKQALLETNVGKSCWEDWCDWVEACTDDLPDTECLADDWDDLPPLADALISGVLRQGHKMLLAGPSKAGKSFALIELCIAIAEGKTWLGRFSCAQGRVLYINLELDRPSCLHRFKDVYTAMGLAPDNLRNIDIWNLRGASVPMDKLAPKLIRRAGKKGYTAVILDPIYKVITGDENSADQMAKFCNQFDVVCRALDCAVIYCHHHSKGAQGGKRSMDRASGSGVFARDPDAMLDMTELTITDAIREQLHNKAACRVIKAMLDKRGHADAYGPDDALSKSRMLTIAKEKLGLADLRAIDAEVAAAQKKADSMTAWRIEGTLREFASFAPVNLWFDYPVHKLDSGLLEDLQPDSDFRTLGAKGASRRWGDKAKQSKDRKAELDTAFEACMMDGEVTVYSLGEYMDLKPRTVKTGSRG